MGKLNILVIGSGGREHALVWKISQSPLAGKVFCAPGNPGIAKFAECVPINVEEIDKLLDFALKEKIGLTIVGPEVPLSLGIVDKFQKKGLKIFGPTQDAARLESSKAFAKKIMIDSKVPTASYQVVANIDEGIELAQTLHKGVVKADGLAAGKGVFVCNSQTEIIGAVNQLLRDRIFGNGSDFVVIEELLEGEEASVLAFCDGENVQLMPSAQDHKRVFDNDKGPNTGGMGAYSPAPVVAKELESKLKELVFLPVLREMKKRGTPYVGVLYAGLMILNGKPRVLEFNCRFGDPEAQAILMRLESDLVEVMLSCLEKKLDKQKIKWSEKPCTCVVLASGGYPDNYEKGKIISGLEKVKESSDLMVFHAGTKIENNKIVTNGGRVFGVSARGKTIKESIDNAYNAVSLIKFDKMHFRKDIGKKAL